MRDLMSLSSSRLVCLSSRMALCFDDVQCRTFCVIVTRILVFDTLSAKWLVESQGVSAAILD